MDGQAKGTTLSLWSGVYCYLSLYWCVRAVVCTPCSRIDGLLRTASAHSATVSMFISLHSRGETASAVWRGRPGKRGRRLTSSSAGIERNTYVALGDHIIARYVSLYLHTHSHLSTWSMLMLNTTTFPRMLDPPALLQPMSVPSSRQWYDDQCKATLLVTSSWCLSSLYSAASCLLELLHSSRVLRWAEVTTQNVQVWHDCLSP